MPHDKDHERDPLVASAFRDLNAKAEPNGEWQARVWARIARAPQEAKQRRTLRAMAGALATLLVLVLASGYWAYSMSRENEEIQAKAKADLTEFQAAVATFEKEIDTIIAQKDEAIEKRLAAKTDQERKLADLRRAALEKQLAAKREALSNMRKSAAKKQARKREKAKRVNAKCDPNDPLCGI